jgi:replicative DNA helicase
MATRIDHAAEGGTLAAAIADEGFRTALLAEPEDLFGDRAHLAIRRAIASLVERGEEVDPVTVAREAAMLGLESADKAVWSLPKATTRHLGLLVRARLERKAAEAARILTSGGDPEERIARAADHLTAALAGSSVTVSQAAEAAAEALRETVSGPPRAVRTGIPALDGALRFLGPGEVLTVGARPGVGKSAFALQLALETARAGHGVALFTLEMRASALARRLIARMSGVGHEALLDGSYDEARVAAALDELRRLPLAIIDRPGLTTSQLRAAALKAKAHLGLKVVVVDYLQLLRLPAHLSSPREYERVTELSAFTRDVARTLGVTVVSLSQLNRGSEERADRRPEPSDLRGSGAIEQDSDAVLLIHRTKAGAELILAKNRSGPTGTVKVRWEPATMSFEGGKTMHV